MSGRLVSGLVLSTLVTLLFFQPLAADAQEWHSNGPYGADVTCLQIAAWDSNKVIAGTRFDGFYIRSLDDIRWHPFAPGLPEWPETINRSPQDDYSNAVLTWGGDHPPVNAFATMPGDPDYLLVGLGERLYRSRDGGETFEMIYEGAMDRHVIKQVWVLPGDPDVLLILVDPLNGDSFVLFSDTAGAEWTPLPYWNVKGIVTDPHDPLHLIMFGIMYGDTDTDAGLVESLDGGYTWNVIQESIHSVFALAASPQEPGVWVGSGANQLLFTTNGFTTFDYFTESQPVDWLAFAGNGQFFTYSPNHSQEFSMVELPESGGDAIWTSRAFQTGDPALNLDAEDTQHFYPVPGQSQMILVASPYGVIASANNGSTAEWWDRGFQNARIDRVLASPSRDHTWYAYGTGGAWVTVDDGNEWTRVAARRTWGIGLHPASEAVIYALDEAIYTSPGTLEATTRRNISGTGKKLQFTGPDTVWAVDAFEADPHLVRYSTNMGESWQFAFNFEMSFEVFLSEDQHQNLIAAGEYMMRISNPLDDPETLDLPEAATDLLTSFEDPDFYVIGISDNMFQSTNAGQTWASFGSQFDPRCVQGRTVGAVVRDGESVEGMYALIRGEDLYHRIGAGNPWTHVDMPEGIDWRTIDVEVNADTILALATHTTGVWIRGGIYNDVPELAAGDAIARSFELSQAWPNPFNPSTRFSFSIVSAGHAKVSVYDVMGRLVGTLADGQFVPGIHQLSWDASGVASGTYFIRLETESGTATRRVVRLR